MFQSDSGTLAAPLGCLPTTGAVRWLAGTCSRTTQWSPPSLHSIRSCSPAYHLLTIFLIKLGLIEILPVLHVHLPTKAYQALPLVIPSLNCELLTSQRGPVIFVSLSSLQQSSLVVNLWQHKMKRTLPHGAVVARIGQRQMTECVVVGRQVRLRLCYPIEFPNSMINDPQERSSTTDLPDLVSLLSNG